MIIPIIIISVGALLLGYFLFEKIKVYSLKAVMIKAMVSLLFIILAVYGSANSNLKTFPKFAIIALSLGMLGDISLDLKYVFKEKDKEFTVAGFIVFALGHIFYITGLFLEFYKGQSVLYILIPLIAGAIMGLVCLLVEKPFKLVYSSYKPIIYIYGTLLFSMTFTTISLWIMSNYTANGMLMLMIAGILFAISDLILNMTYFGDNHEKPFDIISNTLTYYSAQYLIAFCVLFI